MRSNIGIGQICCTFLTQSDGEGAFILEVYDPLLHNAGPAEEEEQQSFYSLTAQQKYSTQRLGASTYTHTHTAESHKLVHATETVCQ